jgi:hypothetical protein
MVNTGPEDASARDPHHADPPSQVIDVRGPGERGARLQLAARWAERFAPREGDHERAALERFRTAHDYVDDVTHGIDRQPERS